MNNKITRTRYAPSPTGNLHIGGARTALFAYLHAKSKGGDFLLRLEDTDVSRNLDHGEQNQLDGLNWLGITPDYSPINPDSTGPFRQSERLDIYEKYVKQLIEEGHAYYSWHTADDFQEELDRQENQGIKTPRIENDFFRSTKQIDGVKPSIRIKVPSGEVYEWDDKVRGKMSIPSSAITDWVIQKSDGLPTYNFANVIDDHLMGITDVHRGEEHLSNTPKQIQLYNLFKWEIPNFYHLTIIINKEGKKLSKRDESILQFVHLYKERGYLPEAVFNFLALLGWSPGGNESENEIFSHQKLIEIFDITRFSKAPSKFDIKKLQWTNNQYIQKLNTQEIFDFLNQYVVDSQLTDEQKGIIFSSFQPGIHEGIEIVNLIKLFTNNLTITQEEIQELEPSAELLNHIYKEFSNLQTWDAESIKNIIVLAGQKLELTGKKLHFPVRKAITLMPNGPELAKVIEIFGKEKTLERLKTYETI